MTSDKTKRVKVSKYIGVTFWNVKQGAKSTMEWQNSKPWCFRLTENGVVHRGPRRATEKEAAIDYDRRVLELNLDRPLNILKRKP